MRLTIFIIAAGFVFTDLGYGQYGGGSGRIDDPYQIWTAEQMNEIGRHGRDWDKHFILMADINLEDYTGWQFRLIGGGNSFPFPTGAFSGVFDGNGHVISNFTYSSTEKHILGLFRIIANGGVIRNVVLEAPSMQAQLDPDRYRFNYGCLAGFVDERGLIENCRVNNGFVSGFEIVGLLVGCNTGTVRNCIASGTASGTQIIGGLAGINWGTIENCYSTGSVKGNKQAGGLVGFNEESIMNCFSASTVDGIDMVDGIAGENLGLIEHCYWDRDVSGLEETFYKRSRSTAEMQRKSTFVGWDFVDIWGIGEGQTYPYLRQYPSGDINHDRTVSLADLAILSEQWLKDNRKPGQAAHEAAVTGHNMMKDWLDEADLSGMIDTFGWAERLFQQISGHTKPGSENAVELENGRSFWIEYEIIDEYTFRLSVTGTAAGDERTIAVDYHLGRKRYPIFDYAVASRGPVQISGNIDSLENNISVDGDVYIESLNTSEALSIIGNGQITGDVYIANPDGKVYMQGSMPSIGGQTGQDALDNHVHAGTAAVEFPVPVTGIFEKYAVGDVIDSSTDTSVDATYENVRIKAGSNPLFSGNVKLLGVVYIEQPNVVAFMGQTSITGIIVGDGDPADNSGTSQIIFLGDISSSPINTLPDESRFEGIRDAEGTFVTAPGFFVAIGGKFDGLIGAIGANGITFFGNAGGTVGGTLMNYSDTPMVLSGNSEIVFKPSDTISIPTGFTHSLFLHHDDISSK